MFVLNEKGRVLALNKTAEQILRRRDGLELLRGTLYARSPDVAARLRVFRARLFKSRAEETLRIFVPRENALPLVCELTSSPSQKRAQGIAFLVFVTDPEKKLQFDAQLLQELFAFTAAEAKTAVSLAAGNGLSSICKQQRIAENTARTHIKRVLQKTNTRRQAQFVQLVSSCGE